MAKGDGPGGNNRSDSPPNDIGPADILLGRLILLAREGNRAAVRAALEQVSEAEIVLARAAQCVRKGAMQSAIGILDREFPRRFGTNFSTQGGNANQVRGRKPDTTLHAAKPINLPLSDLKLPLRVLNSLERSLGAVTVGDLLKFTPEDIIAARQLGRGGFDLICSELAKLGLKVRQPNGSWNGAAFVRRNGNGHVHNEDDAGGEDDQDLD